ncbi:hypothetical protein LQV63_23675 [Paenibacillus profundus]|uniref:3D domain-containing protein n=1 Tax=Paenibacillus profundus TaxID=1173085 RepID=A0ABS8YPA5_9BACL|nr:MULTISPECIES: hypothetical protein [Paenibacillus]MCE5172283.1 hypothetical protein [Paenibacillus profundus]
MKKSLFTMLISVVLAFTTSSAAFADTTYTNQDFTAYTGASGDNSPVFASGNGAYIGGIAVHPSSWGSSNWNKPIYRFGAMIVLNNNQRITIPGGYSLNTFIVEDTGDLNNAGNLTYRWIDVYFGKYSAATHQAAINFGKKKFSYTVIS